LQDCEPEHSKQFYITHTSCWQKVTLRIYPVLHWVQTEGVEQVMQFTSSHFNSHFVPYWFRVYED